MPLVAQQFIKLFDGFYLMPNLRVLLPEFEFAIEIPEEVIDEINIDELKVLTDRIKIGGSGKRRFVYCYNNLPLKLCLIIQSIKYFFCILCGQMKSIHSHIHLFFHVQGQNHVPLFFHALAGNE